MKYHFVRHYNGHALIFRLAYGIKSLRVCEWSYEWVFITYWNPLGLVCGLVPWLYPVLGRCVYFFCGFMSRCIGTLTGNGNGPQHKVSSDRLGEAGNQTCDPWFTRHRFIPYTFLWLTLVPLRFVCSLYDGNNLRLTESGFMEKPGIEPRPLIYKT